MDKNEPSFSILIAVYNQAQELHDNLPTYLTQQYSPGYEVIVIDESSTDETPDVLKLLKQEYPTLYSTFLPKPNRLVSRRKLAFNIGTKASHNEWIIIINSINKMMSESTLQDLAGAMDQYAELYLGYIRKKDIRLQSFDSCEDVRSHILKAEHKLRKVIHHKHLKFAMGRYDFIIVRRDHVYDVLNFFEQKLSFFTLLKTRLTILWKNVIRPYTTLPLHLDINQETEK